jgi:hypothetical protein
VYNCIHPLITSSFLGTKSPQHFVRKRFHSVLFSNMRDQALHLYKMTWL